MYFCQNKLLYAKCSRCEKIKPFDYNRIKWSETDKKKFNFLLVKFKLDKSIDVILMILVSDRRVSQQKRGLEPATMKSHV